MAVKPVPGATITETRTTTVQPSSETRRLSDGTPIVSKDEFWDWIESTPIETLAKYEAVINLYRIDGSKRSLCEQFYYPPDAVRFSRGWIKKFYGGGVYNVMVKLEKQLRFNIDLPIEGLPKNPEEIEAARTGANGNGANAAGYSGAGSETTIVLRELVGMLRDELRAARGGDAAADAMRNSMNLGISTLQTAVPAVAQIVASAAGAGAQPPQNPLVDRLLTVAIDRMLAPPASQQNALMDKLLNTAVERLMNPGESSAGGTETLAQTLVRVAPSILERIDSGMSKMATLRQQEIEMMRMRGGAPPPQQTINVQPPPPAQPNPLPPAANGQAAPPAQQQAAPGAGMGVQDFLELGIARIATNPKYTVEAAAYEMLILLDAYVPELVDGTCQDPNAEAELLKMFRERPILQQVPQNPRLTEIVQKFLEKARESRNTMQPPEGAQPGGIPPGAQPEAQQPSA